MDSIVLKLITLCLLMFVLRLYEVQGMMNTPQEDLELEKQMHSLNKPFRKTIRTKYGEIIDCIDIYKQPSFNHPLLKDHKIQMRPTIMPKSVDDGYISTTKKEHFTMAMLNPINCPLGTVPIRRTHKSDLIRAKSFTEKFAAKQIHPQTKFTPGRHQAIVRSVFNPKVIYKGIEAVISIYKPDVKANQSSFAQIWIEGGPPNVRNSLQAGWMVAPDLYGDNNTRSFIYWSVEGNPKRGCFNLLCEGFVQVDKSFTLAYGGILTPSEYDSKTKHAIMNQIHQDPRTSHWWLSVPSLNVTVGYWPKELFPNLVRGATQVVWGGQVFGKPNGASPGMGNGHLPDGNFRHASFAAQMKIVDPNLRLIEPGGPYYQMESFADNSNCYNVQYFGYKDQHYGFSFLFGGPGGPNCGI